MNRKTTVIGLLGTSLDAGIAAHRWEKWRPTVSICQHEDLLIDRFELLHSRKATKLASCIAEDIHSVSPETTVRPHVVEMDDPWDFEQVYGALHDFARGYAFDTDHEDYLVHITTGTHVAQICLFLLIESHHIPGKLLQTSPPPRSRPHEPGQYRIIDLDLSKYDRIASRFRQETCEGLSFLKSGIDTRNPAFNALIERIERVAVATRDPILLIGPTGAGKSQLARRIYELKKSRHAMEGPFVEVNSATLRGDAAMSALFGHVKGAFTGAASDRPGLLRRSDHGVLFLDEIGDLGADEQAMLLRAIEDKAFLPVGSDAEVQSDFQLIAGTNCDLRAAVRERRFRDDLLARINLWTFCLPGLRERREDIEPNLDYELAQYAERTGVQVTFSREARDEFLAFAMAADSSWNGNFRDLSAAVTRMATLAQGGRISIENVRDEIARLREAWTAEAGAGDSESLVEFLGPEKAQQIDEFDRVQLAAVLRVCRSARSLSEAGRALFANSRTQKKKQNDADRLRKYLARFGLDWNRVTEDRLA